MDFKRLMRLMPTYEREKIQKVIDILRIGGKSEKTIANYVHAIHRFLKYFHDQEIEQLCENDILEYFKHNYLSKKCAGNTYNMNNCNQLGILYKKRRN